MQEPESPGGERRLQLRPHPGSAAAGVALDEMVVRLERESSLTDERIRALAAHAPIRRFEDAEGTVWTAEVKAPRLAAATDPEGAPMVLFSSEQRACLIAIRPVRGLGELKPEELRTLLDTCLNG